MRSTTGIGPNIAPSTNRPVTARRVRHMILAAAVTLMLALSSVACVSRQSVPFEQGAWTLARGQRPIGMAYDIERENRVMGMSRGEVIRMLGTPDFDSGRDPEDAGNYWFTYYLQHDWTLEVNFSEDRVDWAQVIPAG